MTDRPSISEDDRGSTRRRVLWATGTAELAGGLGLAGWTGRLLYLHGEKEQTSIDTVETVTPATAARNRRRLEPSEVSSMGHELMYDAQ